MKYKSVPEEVTKRYIQSYYTLYGMRLVSNRQQFCDATLLKPQNFSAIEHGKRGASMVQVCALISNLPIDPIWLMTGQGDMLL